MSSESGRAHTTTTSTLPPTAVRAQLDKILASDTFSRSERLSNFLRYVVEETLRGTGVGLKEAVISRELYRRGDDFETATDPIVRVDARRLRDKLREYPRPNQRTTHPDHASEGQLCSGVRAKSRLGAARGALVYQSRSRGRRRSQCARRL